MRNGLAPPKTLEEWAPYCDVGWKNELPAWADKKALEFITSQLHYNAMLTLRNTHNRRWFWRILFRSATMLLMFRIKRKLYSFHFARVIFEILKKPRFNRLVEKFL